MKTKFLLTTAICCTAAIGATALFASNARTKTDSDVRANAKDGAHSKAPALPVVHPAKTPTEVADRIDSLLQPRFQERAEDFGISRIYRPLTAHEFTVHDEKGRYRQPLYSLIARSEEERDLLSAANSANRGYVVGFLHCASTLSAPTPQAPTDDKGKGRHPAVRMEPAAYFEPLVIHEAENADDALKERAALNAWQRENMQAVNSAIKEAAPRARQGKKMEVQAGDWTLVLRPVKAEQSACLACHVTAKKGETLGVMAYAIRR